MTDRLFSTVLLVLTLCYGLAALSISVPFVFDPLGPRPLPLTLTLILSGLLVILLLRPLRKVSDRTAPFRILLLCGVMLFYLLTWTSLGFLLSTTISVYLLTRLLKGTWMQGLMTALLVSVCAYGLFHFLLNISLPLGTIFTIGG